jgi:hypothetical protein
MQARLTNSSRPLRALMIKTGDHLAMGADRPPGPGAAGHSGYLPVSEHGLIGDLHCVALVGTNGTIDWHCCPSFDSPSVFGSPLDADGGGSFELAASVPAETRQFYLPDSQTTSAGGRP